MLPVNNPCTRTDAVPWLVNVIVVGGLMVCASTTPKLISGTLGTIASKPNPVSKSVCGLSGSLGTVRGREARRGCGHFKGDDMGTSVGLNMGQAATGANVMGIEQLAPAARALPQALTSAEYSTPEIEPKPVRSIAFVDWFVRVTVCVEVPRPVWIGLKLRGFNEKTADCLHCVPVPKSTHTLPRSEVIMLFIGSFKQVDDLSTA